jgi:peptidoglycan/xylan/chitin deacetylase (PgdA/CDA1 family)
MTSLFVHVCTMRERTSFTSALPVTLPALTEMMVKLPKHDSVNLVNLTPPLSSWSRTLPKNMLMLTFDDEFRI